MRPIFLRILLVFLLFTDVVIADEQKTVRQYTFTWPYSEAGAMAPRGGTTKGPSVTLEKSPTDYWEALQEKNIDTYERDRRAILAMQGGYRASFDFIEVAGFLGEYEPTKPYQSWGTEYVYLLADTGDFISLQHILVMIVKLPDGSLTDPFVVKHWRQDWQFEDRSLMVYAGHNTWVPQKLPQREIKGTWSQTVFQVDDSPRYEATGSWQHTANHSSWLSTETWRPLPRREFSVRNDYQVLIGTNRHTITPMGWTHQEDNLKVILTENGMIKNGGVLAQELGFNRYERITGFDFSAGDDYWSATRGYWAEVRDAWRKVYDRGEQITLSDEVDGKRLFEFMFRHAAEIEKEGGEGSFDAKMTRSRIDETLELFLRTS